MIDVQRVLKDVPRFDTFCSVEKLHKLVETLRSDERFEVKIAGASANQVPIHHVRFGRGSTKALFVGHGHCMEPLNGLTIFSLISLLSQGHRELLKQDVEWHFVPVIDPDGALLNEGWTQKPFTFANYMRNHHQQPWLDQVDFTFPIRYKKMAWDKPTPEAKVLAGVIDKVRPDYFYHGHDARLYNGSWYYISRDIDSKYYHQLQSLLEQFRIPLHVSAVMEQHFVSFGAGIYEAASVRKLYDAIEKTAPTFIDGMFANHGASSKDYLEGIKPEALQLVGELTYVRYTGGDLKHEIQKTLRQIMLRVAADNKFIASVMLEEWEKVKNDVDTTSPFYRKMMADLISQKDKLHEGLLSWYEMSTQSLLSDPWYARKAMEGDRIDAQMGFSGRFGFLCNAYEFVRLLKASKQTSAVREAAARLEKLFDEALEEIDAEVDFGKFEAIDCSTLAKVYTGSGLIALNAVLEERR